MAEAGSSSPQRVAFLLEEQEEWVSCMLNPEGLTLNRSSGIRSHRSTGGIVTGRERPENPVLDSGGGITELRLQLLFDTSLPGSSIRTGDVRDLTGRIWALSGDGHRAGGGHRVPRARFIWGVAWNLPVVVTELAERLEYFDGKGFPRRSWITLRLLRVGEADADQPEDGGQADLPPPETLAATPPERMSLRRLQGSQEGGAGNGAAAERLDAVAAEVYGRAGFWRVIAWANGIADPLRLRLGEELRLPPRSEDRR